MLNVESILRLMERQAREAGIALCPFNNAIYAKLNRGDDNVFWIKDGCRSTRDEVERALREASGFSPEVALNPYRRG